MFSYSYVNCLQLEINTKSKIGRVLLDTSHIADITPSTIIIFHPEVFYSIDKEIIEKSDFKFEFLEPSHILKSCERFDFRELLMMIQMFRRTCL